MSFIEILLKNFVTLEVTIQIVVFRRISGKSSIAILMQNQKMFFGQYGDLDYFRIVMAVMHFVKS